MKKITLFGLIALMVLAMAIPASAALKLTGTLRHYLEYSNMDVTTENPVTSQLRVRLSAITTDAATDPAGKITIEMPLQITFSGSTPVVALPQSSSTDSTWRIGYESPVFSLTVSNASGDFGKFGDPMGVANSAVNDNVRVITEPTFVDGANVPSSPTALQDNAKDAMIELLGAYTFSASGTRNKYISINTWGKIGKVSYDLSILDYKLSATAKADFTVNVIDDKFSKTVLPDTNAISIALRLKYDLTDALTLGVIGMVTNQFDVNRLVFTIPWTNESTEGDRTINAGGIAVGTTSVAYRKLMHTFAFDAAYNLSKTTIGGSVFGQVAVSVTRFGTIKNGLLETSKDGTFNGVAFALGAKDIKLGGLTVGATVALTGADFVGTNNSSHSNPSAWGSKYLPSYTASNATNTRYFVPLDESASLLLPNSFIVIAKASGSWTLGNDAILDVSAKNGLNMYVKAVDNTAGTGKASFINNLFQISANYYVYGLDATGKELAKNSKTLVKAGLYFDPRFVNVVTGAMNNSFEFATRAYAGVDFKNLGLQVDADFRYTNHVSKAMELSLWAAYKTNIEIANMPVISTNIAVGYNYVDDVMVLGTEKYDFFHNIFGYVGGTLTFENGIKVTLYDAVRFKTGANLRRKVGANTDIVVPEQEIVNVVRLTASKDLNNIYNVAFGVTNLTWYNSDKAVYMKNSAALVDPAQDVETAKTQSRIYFDASFTAKISSTATIKVTYGMTGLNDIGGFSSGKLWNTAGVGSDNQNNEDPILVTGARYTTKSDGSVDKYHADDNFVRKSLKPMAYDKFSIEFSFTF